jgi:steroid delta-isomerase-like uncharacterized protein
MPGKKKDAARDAAKANAAMVRRRFRELDKKNFAILDELFDRGYVLNFDDRSEPMGLPATKRFYQTLYSAFPDLKHTVVEQVSVGNKVVTRWTATGTHKRDFMGVAATDRRVNLSGINIYTIKRGKLSESHVNWDLLGLMHQLSAVPSHLRHESK